jgi:hypothetical protein
MLGFKLTSTGEFLDTQGVTISYTLKSPVFRDNDNDGSFIFNTSIPATDKNKRICKFPLRIEAYREMTVEEPIQVYFNGLVIWEGTMIAKFARPEEIEISIGLGRGEFNHEAEGKKLTDVVPDEVHTVGQEQIFTDWNNNAVLSYHRITGFDNIVSKFYPEINFAVFPIKIESLTESLGAIFDDWYNETPVVNFWDIKKQRFFRNDIDQAGVTIENVDGINIMTYIKKNNVFVPFVYNSWVFKNIFLSLGYFLENNPFEQDNDFKRLVLYNIQSINRLNYSYQHGNNNTYFTHGYFYEIEPDLQINLKNHIPDINVKDYLRELENMFFFRCFINNKTRKIKIVFLKDIILDNEYIDITDKVIIIKERKLEYDKIGRLIQEYDSSDGNNTFKTPEEFNKMVRIADSFWKEDLPDNTSGLYENKISLAKLEECYYLSNSLTEDFTHISKWEPYTWNYFLEKIICDRGKDYTVKASGIINTYFADVLPGTSATWEYEWFIPYCKQNLKFYNTQKTNYNTCGIRFMFYRGIQDGKRRLWGTPPEGECFYHLNDGQYNEAIDFLVAYQIPHNWAVELLIHFTNESDYWSYNSILAFCVEHNTVGASGTTVANWLAYFFENYCYQVWGRFIREIHDGKYPLGTNDVYNAYGQKIPEANLSLKWDGQYGIYERFAKEFITWYNTMAKPVTILMQPTVEDLFMDFSVKKRINGIDYLLDEIRGEITGDKLSVAEVDAWSC